MDHPSNLIAAASFNSPTLGPTATLARRSARPASLSKLKRPAA
jgi:hypothetical protein